MRHAGPRARRGLAIAPSSAPWRAADLVLTVNPRDVAGVKARLRPGAHQVRLPPFIDTAPFRAAARQNC